MSIRPLKWILLGPVWALLLLGHCFGAEWQDPPAGQPDQMWSKVNYDPKLTDRFFKSKEWSYPYGGQIAIRGMWPEGEAPPRLKHTARCSSTSHGTEHEIRFCEARLLDVDTITLFIHEKNPELIDKVWVRIVNGMFRCQYETSYKRFLAAAAIWTTTRQELTLDKNVYRKGDVIKGRIDFECLQRATDPEYVKIYGGVPDTIKFYGVFKTIVQ
jgi:hypothetical protein